MKLIIASIIIFSLIILFLFALFPSDISVTRILRVSASAEKLNSYISRISEWKNWNEFVKSTPQINNGFQMDSMGIHTNGVSVRIIQSVPDTIRSLWQQGDRHFTGTYILTPAGGQTIVEWTLLFHIRWYPWEKLASMFYDKELGPVMESSLLNLQKVSESAVDSTQTRN